MRECSWTRLEVSVHVPLLLKSGSIVFGEPARCSTDVAARQGKLLQLAPTFWWVQTGVPPRQKRGGGLSNLMGGFEMLQGATWSPRKHIGAALPAKLEIRRRNNWAKRPIQVGHRPQHPHGRQYQFDGEMRYSEACPQTWAHDVQRIDTFHNRTRPKGRVRISDAQRTCRGRH